MQYQEFDYIMTYLISPVVESQRCILWNIAMPAQSNQDQEQCSRVQQLLAQPAIPRSHEPSIPTLCSFINTSKKVPINANQRRGTFFYGLPYALEF